MQQLKWPIEYLFVGAKVNNYFAPSDTSLLRQNLDCWDKYSKYTNQAYYTDGYQLGARQLLCTANAPSTDTLGVSTAGVITGTAASALTNKALAVGDKISIAGHTFTTTATTAINTTLIGVQLSPAIPVAITAANANYATAFLLTQQGLEVDTKRWAPTIETINISAHGIDIYKLIPSSFFNSYTTYHYGGPNINAPKDVGSLFVPFCLYPGTYQPSGHINVSRAREFYLTYTATTFDPTANAPLTGLLVVIASAISEKLSCRICKAYSSHTRINVWRNYRIAGNPR